MKTSLRSHALSLAAGLVVTISPLHAAGSHDSFRVTGAIQRPGAWTVARLRTDFSQSIRLVHFNLKGKPGTAHAVPLITILKAVAPRVNAHIKNHLLSFVVLVTGADGYTAAFSLAELEPAIGDRAVWVAVDENGKPLPDEDGPVSLIVPQDKKAGRWVHGVAAITVIDGTSLPGR